MRMSWPIQVVVKNATKLAIGYSAARVFGARSLTHCAMVCEARLIGQVMKKLVTGEASGAEVSGPARPKAPHEPACCWSTAAKTRFTATSRARTCSSVS